MDRTKPVSGTLRETRLEHLVAAAGSCDITLVSSDKIRFGTHVRQLREASNFFDGMFEIGSDNGGGEIEIVLPESDLEKSDNLSLLLGLVYGEPVSSSVCGYSGNLKFPSLGALIRCARSPAHKMSILERLVLLLVKYDAVHLMYVLGEKLEELMDGGKLSPLDVFQLGDETRCVPLSLRVIGNGCHYTIGSEVDTASYQLQELGVNWFPDFDSIEGASMLDPTATSLMFYESLPDRMVWCWVKAYREGAEISEAFFEDEGPELADKFGRLMKVEDYLSDPPISLPPAMVPPEDDPEIRRVTLISADSKRFEANRSILLRHCPLFRETLKHVANTMVVVQLDDESLESSALLSLVLDLIHGKKIPRSRLSAPPTLISTDADRREGHRARERNYFLCRDVWHLLRKYKAPRQTINVFVKLVVEWMKDKLVCPYWVFRMALEMDRMDLCVKAVDLSALWTWSEPIASKPEASPTQFNLRAHMTPKAWIFDVTSFSFNHFVDMPRKVSWALLRASREVPETVVSPEEIDWVAVRDKYDELMTGEW